MEINKNRTVFSEFSKVFSKMPCFTSEQVKVWKDDFYRNNFTNWVNSGKIIRLKRNVYTISDDEKNSNTSFSIANNMYAPSYISLHTALKYYGIIPEEIFSITSISTNKTYKFKTKLGDFYYNNVKTKMFFGYDIIKDERNGYDFKIAYPEKAIIDLLYLYPQYNTKKEIEYLRFDEDFMKDEFNKTRFIEYYSNSKNKALIERCKLVLEVYCDK